MAEWDTVELMQVLILHLSASTGVRSLSLAGKMAFVISSSQDAISIAFIVRIMKSADADQHSGITG